LRRLRAEIQIRDIITVRNCAQKVAPAAPNDLIAPNLNHPAQIRKIRSCTAKELTKLTSLTSNPIQRAIPDCNLLEQVWAVDADYH